MKTLRKHSAFTLIELLVVVSIIAIIAALAIGAIPAALRTVRMNAQMNDGTQVAKAMKNYAGVVANAGRYPTYEDVEDASTIVNSSNKAFQILLKGGYLDDKKVFFNPNSAWCKVTAKNENTAKQVMSGENDWCYVRAIKDTDNSRWPLLANAFQPGGTTYTSNKNEKGGAWGGTKAVVIYAGGNGEVVDTKEQGSTYYIGRTDKPRSDAFQKDGDWLNGDDIMVLYPEG